MAHNLENLFAITLTESQPDLLLVEFEQVLIFESHAWVMIRSFDDTVDHGAFEIEDAEPGLFRHSFHTILHDEQFNWLLILHADRIDAVHSGKKTVIMAIDMGEVGLLNTLESIEVAVGHSLNEELAILGEEKEAATLSRAFACLESLFSIKYWN